MVLLFICGNLTILRDGDWNCLKCGANNFSRRTFCFKQDCKAPKPTTREERGSFRGDRRDSGGPHPGDQRGPGDYRGPGDQRGSFRGDRRDSEGPHPGDQRHFGQTQPPMPSPQSTVSLIFSIGTIHLRRRKFFMIFDPYPLPSTFQQNAYERDY